MSSEQPKRNSSGRRARTRDARAAQASTGTNYIRAAGEPVDELAPGTVRIRLEAVDAAGLDTHEAALRSVLEVSESSRDYGNRRGVGSRRYLRSTGIRTASAVLPPSPLAVADDAKRRRDLVGEISTLLTAGDDLRGQPWLPLVPGDVVLTYLPAQGGSPSYGVTYLATGDDSDPDTGAMLREVSQPDATENLNPDYLLSRDLKDRWRVQHEHWDTGIYVDLAVQPDDMDPDNVEAIQAWAAEAVADDAGADPAGWRPYGVAFVPSWRGDASAGGQLLSFYELWFEAGPAALTVIRSGAIVHGVPTRH
jgi:hypothetical protein